MTMRREALLLVIAATSTASVCVGQSRGSTLPTLPSAGENYSTRIWQTRDGLPQETVQAVAQTPDGFLWIGTTGGLLRFDGSHFVTYERGNTPEFHENSVFSLMTAHDGTRWIGTEGGGLLRMSAQQFRRFGVIDGLTDEFVRTELEPPSRRSTRYARSVRSSSAAST